MPSKLEGIQAGEIHGGIMIPGIATCNIFISSSLSNLIHNTPHVQPRVPLLQHPTPMLPLSKYHSFISDRTLSKIG